SIGLRNTGDWYFNRAFGFTFQLGLPPGSKYFWVIKNTGTMKTTLLLTAFLVGSFLQPAYGTNENARVKWDQPLLQNGFRKAYSRKGREVPVSISPVRSLKTEGKEWPPKKVRTGRPSEN